MNELPDGWRPATLNAFCSLRGETVNPARYGDLPYVGLEHIDSGLPVLLRHGRATDVSSAKAKFQAGDVLFGKLRPNLEKSVIAPFDGVCSTDILVITPRWGLDSKYLSFLTHSNALTSHAVKSIGGVNLPRTSWTALREFKFALPPLPEQRAIAAALYSVQDVRAARRTELERERERKAALMEDLFTRGTRGEQSKAAEIGTIPESWEVTNIENVSSVVSSGVTPRGGEKSYVKDGIPLIRSQNVVTGRLKLNDVAHISPETHQAMIRSATKPFDVLLNITGASIGRVAYIPESLQVANVNQHVCRIRLLKNAYAPFVSYFLNFRRGQSQIMGSQFGTTRQGLNYGQVKAIKISLPSMDEQRDIADVLTACDAKIAALEAEATLHNELFRALLEELMMGRVSARGLIDAEATQEEHHDTDVR